MPRTRRHIVLFAAAIAVALTGTVAAYDGDRLLNTLELRKLVARGDLADHARLAAHFLTLSDRYEAEAARHERMASAVPGNPNRTAGADLSGYFRQLAERNTESATTTLDLADYHARLALELDATWPLGGGRFESGAGARAPTGAELKALGRQARTPAEHRDLEEYFVTAARGYTAEANAHTAFANAYRGTRLAHAAAHHDHLALTARRAATQAKGAAEMHKVFAALGR
jgi:hypothetical protein